MSDIPSMTISEFRALKVPQIKELKSVEIYADGDHLFTAIIPHGDMFTKGYAKTEAEALGLKTNIPGGKDPSELKEKADADLRVPV